MTDPWNISLVDIEAGVQKYMGLCFKAVEVESYATVLVTRGFDNSRFDRSAPIAQSQRPCHTIFASNDGQTD